MSERVSSSSGAAGQDPGGPVLLNRYRVDERRRGGMGVLYFVTDVATGEGLVLKTVPRSQKDDPDVLRRFRREARVWMELGHHERVVQAYRLLETDEGPFLVLERVWGRDLADLLGGGPLPLPQALDLALQCAEGMVHAHEREWSEGIGLLHRDLSPSNLLVTPDGALKITDFGLARVLRARSARITSENAVLGTLAYMAPEQLLEADRVDGRADVYAFGLVLLEMLVGQHPLRSPVVSEQMRLIRDVEPPVPGDLPSAVGALLERSLRKDREQRPRDFREVRAHLALAAREIRGVRWHVDPAAVPPPAHAAALAAAAPLPRPRRPRQGQPFGLEVRLSGDLGSGPVDVAWAVEPRHIQSANDRAASVEVLTPGRTAQVRIEAGGRTPVALRLHLSAPSRGRYHVTGTRVVVAGPGGSVTCPVPSCTFTVDRAFQLPLVGRDVQREQLREAVQRLRAGSAGMLLVTGERGSGKSRLLEEGARLAGAAGIATAWGRAENGELRPMRTLTDAARELLSIPEGDVLRDRVAASLRDVLPDDETARRYFSGILTGRASGLEETPSAHPWYALFRAALRRGPLMVVLDDFHRAAPAAHRIVAEVFERVSAEGLPLLLLVGRDSSDADPEAQRRGLRFQERVKEIRNAGAVVAIAHFPPLDREAIRGLLDSAFPGNGFREEAPWLAQTIFDVTQGNAYHATEMLRLLRDGEHPGILQEGGAWRVHPGLSAAKLREQVPDELGGLVLRTVTSLDREVREVLEAAALAGPEFDVALLRVVLPRARGEHALKVLEERELIFPASADLDRYRFANALIPATIERDLLLRAPERFRDLHAALADGLRQSYGGERLYRRSLQVAHHLRASGQDAASLVFTLQGCERLLNLRAVERARQLLLAAGPVAAASETDPLLRRRYDYVYGLACESSGDYETGFGALLRFADGEPQGSGFQERRRVARAHMALARIHQARGELNSAQARVERVRTILEEIDDRRSLPFVYNALARLALERGRYARTAEHLDRADRAAREAGNPGAAGQADVLRGRLLLEWGETKTALQHLRRAEEVTRRLGDRRRLAPALEGLARAELQAGYLDRSRKYAEEAARVYGGMGDREGIARARLRRGEAFAAAGQLSQALREVRLAQRAFEAIGHSEGVARARFLGGRLHRQRGKISSALRELAASADALQRMESPLRHGVVRELGLALVDSGNSRAARTMLARADRGEAYGWRRRQGRLRSRVARARLHLDDNETRSGGVWASRAARHAARWGDPRALVHAHRLAGEAALLTGDLVEARRRVATSLAYAREAADPLARAGAEALLAHLAGRTGRAAEAKERAHRAARAYTGRADAGDGPARLLRALALGLTAAADPRAGRYRRAARRCAARLESQGYRSLPL